MRLLGAVAIALCCCALTALASATFRPGEITDAFGWQLERVWAKCDMSTVRAMLTDDCDWMSVVGMHWHGRDEVIEMHHVLLEGRYKGFNFHTLSHEESEL